MGYGAYFPYPRRFGGGRPLLRIVHEALNAAQGDAIDANNSATYAWTMNMACARALTFDGYGTNERLALQTDPRRMTDMLGRWERILHINPPPNATAYDRRQKVLRRFRRFLYASAFHSKLVAILREEIPEVFVAIEYIGAINAIVHVPDESYPWGSVVPGFPWYSTIAHVLIFLQKPEGYSEQNFYDAAAKVGPAIDGVLPGTATFDWYRMPASGVPIEVDEGPSQAGFYLDNDHNLDNNVFDDGEVDPAQLSLTAWLRGGDYSA